MLMWEVGLWVNPKGFALCRRAPSWANRPCCPPRCEPRTPPQNRENWENLVPRSREGRIWVRRVSTTAGTFAFGSPDICPWCPETIFCSRPGARSWLPKIQHFQDQAKVLEPGRGQLGCSIFPVKVRSPGPGLLPTGSASLRHYHCCKNCWEISGYVNLVPRNHFRSASQPEFRVSTFSTLDH